MSDKLKVERVEVGEISPTIEFAGMTIPFPTEPTFSLHFADDPLPFSMANISPGAYSTVKSIGEGKKITDQVHQIFQSMVTSGGNPFIAVEHVNLDLAVEQSSCPYNQLPINGTDTLGLINVLHCESSGSDSSNKSTVIVNQGIGEMIVSPTAAITLAAMYNALLTFQNYKIEDTGIVNPSHCDKVGVYFQVKGKTALPVIMFPSYQSTPRFLLGYNFKEQTWIPPPQDPRRSFEELVCTLNHEMRTHGEEKIIVESVRINSISEDGVYSADARIIVGGQERIYPMIPSNGVLLTQLLGKGNLYVAKELVNRNREHFTQSRRRPD